MIELLAASFTGDTATRLGKARTRPPSHDVGDAFAYEVRDDPATGPTQHGAILGERLWQRVPQ